MELENTINLDIPESPTELLELQNRRRIAAVVQAKKSEFFREKLDDLDVERIVEPEEWAKIPILDKEQLRAMDAEVFYGDFCIGQRKDVTEYWRSGGSTGKPLFYPKTKEDIDYAQIGFQRSLDLAGFTDDDITHNSLPLGIHPAGHMMSRSGSEMGIGMIWAGGGNTLPSRSQLDLIKLFQPTSWIGMASYGIQLANLASAEGFDLKGSSVEKILCSAEPLSDSKRSKLSSLWGAEVYDCYGMTEVMMLGCEDESRDGFRFWSDYCYPEVLDENTMEPVGEGEPGLLVVTSLVTNNATPFIRWNTGDVVTMRQDIVIGTDYDVFPLIKHTHRTAGFVKVRGINIGFTDLEDVLFGLENVSDFRVEVNWEDDKDQLDIFLEVPTGVDEHSGSEQVKTNVQRIFGLTPRIFMEEPGSISKQFENSFKPVRITDLRD